MLVSVGPLSELAIGLQIFDRPRQPHCLAEANVVCEVWILEASQSRRFCQDLAMVVSVFHPC